MEANMTGKIEWWATAGPRTKQLTASHWWRRATRAQVEALRPPHACYAVLTCCDGSKVRSSAIPAAGGVTVLLTVGPWQAPFYTVQATEYGEILREVETRLAETAAMTAD